MDMIKCPECGELYSSSYKRCPFCEEDGDSPRMIAYRPRRHIAARSKAQSARGAMIVVLLFARRIRNMSSLLVVGIMTGIEINTGRLHYIREVITSKRILAPVQRLAASI